MPKGNKYKKVDTLTIRAKAVSEYAKENNITPAYVYIKHTRGVADYDIVNCMGLNWVEPLTPPPTLTEAVKKYKETEKIPPKNNKEAKLFIETPATPVASNYLKQRQKSKNSMK